MMQKYKLMLITCLLSLTGLVSANPTYLATNIPEALKKGAYAVVRESTMDFVQTNENSGVLERRIVVTILDKKGEGHASFYGTFDKFQELSRFSGVIYDTSGKIVKKIKKGDLTQSSIDFGAFTTDNYALFYEYKHPVFPYTVEYTYQIKYKNGIISYYPFSPYLGFDISVEKAEYKLETPDNFKLRSKSVGDISVKTDNQQGKNIYSMAVENLSAISNEPNSPKSYDIFPRVYLAPTDFCYDAVCGNMADWKSYGLWVNSLLKGRDELPEDVVLKIKELTANAKTDREKVGIVYDYLQKNSRYVSIQLGIGGFQPIPATAVHKNRFGDCKGLSNLMKAMLKAIGIESNYCEIGVNRSDILYADFANVSQTDHAILLVPLKNDSIWLECTLQTLPFGFVHDGIAGHDAVVISDEGGKLCRLPTYSENENVTNSNVVIELNENGDAEGSVMIAEHLFNYDDVISYLRDKERKKVVEYVNARMAMPKMELGEFNVIENKSSRPSVLFDAKFNAPGFANRTGTRLFLPICPLAKANFNRYSATERTHDIAIRSGYTDNDSITFNLPKGFVVESLPKDVVEDSKYGSITTHAEEKDGAILYTQTIVIHKGTFPKEEYNDIKEFYRKINNALKRKIVAKQE